MDVLSSNWTLSTGNELIAGNVGERLLSRLVLILHQVSYDKHS